MTATDRPLLFDASAQARLFGDGPDLLGLLNRLSTGEVSSLGEGDSARTVLTTNKGRIVAQLFVHRLPAGVLLVGGTGQAEAILAHIARYTFAEQTGLTDRTDATAQLGLCGAESDELLAKAGLPTVAPGAAVSIADDVWLLGHDGESTQGRSIVLPRAEAASWQERLGGTLVEPEAIAAARIRAGIPVSGKELTEQANPLEAGLRDAVSFTKGCYVGQEVVARLENYDKVSRRLLGVRIDSGVLTTGTTLFADERPVGQVTSAAGRIALALIKSRAAAPGDTVRAGADGPAARLVALPFDDR